MSKHSCEHCANTGILNASLKKSEGGAGIAVVLCGGHYEQDVAEKNCVAMSTATGLEIDIVGVGKTRT